MENLTSRTINFLRFPLVILVTLIHSYLDLPVTGYNLVFDQVPVYSFVSFLISQRLARIAVPTFFLMSGFLFFYRLGDFSKEIYSTKLRKRIKTLLIPYLFWNIIAIFFYLLAQKMFPQYCLKGGASNLINNGWYGWYNAFFLHPINGPLWYIRDLMEMSLLTPLVYFITKKTGVWSILMLGILFLLDIKIPVIGQPALFFFSLGAYFSIFKINFTYWCANNFHWLSVVYFILLIISMVYRDYSWCNYLQNVDVFLGIFMVWGITAYFLGKGSWHENTFLTKANFFIYVFQGILLGKLNKSLYIIIKPESDGGMFVVYFLFAFIIIVGGLILYKLLNKFMPKFFGIITGDR